VNENLYVALTNHKNNSRLEAEQHTNAHTHW